MKFHSTITILGLLCVGAVSPVLADGDVAIGKALAEEHCARCHDISPTGGSKLEPPSFRSIAMFRPREQIYARILVPWHPYMPDFSAILPDMKQIEDIVAYIVSLEK